MFTTIDLRDLTDLAAVEPLRKGGRIYLVDPDALGAAPVAALLRY